MLRRRIEGWLQKLEYKKIQVISGVVCKPASKCFLEDKRGEGIRMRLVIFFVRLTAGSDTTQKTRDNTHDITIT
jgi:hypothetical protein